MTDSTPIADALGIGEGWTVWVIGDSIEETALLDPMPEGASTVEEPPVDGLDAALLLTDDALTLAEHLDDALPRLGSTPSVWVCFPPDDLDVSEVARVVDDYGWWAGEPVELDETWSAVRLQLG